MNLRPVSVALLLLTGCATYAPPAEGPVANLRVVAPGVTGLTYNVAVHTYSNATCGGDQKIVQLGGLGGSTKATSVGMPKYKTAKDSEVVETRIRAGQTFHIGFSLAKQWSGQCHLTMSFDPEQDHNYEAVVDSTPDICHVDIYELVTSPDGSIGQAPVKSLAKNERSCVPLM